MTCPSCGFTNVVRLQQVELEQEFICEGCLQTVQLKDADKSVAKAIDAIEDAMGGLGNMLRREFR